MSPDTIRAEILLLAEGARAMRDQARRRGDEQLAQLHGDRAQAFTEAASVGTAPSVGTAELPGEAAREACKAVLRAQWTLGTDWAEIAMQHIDAARNEVARLKRELAIIQTETPEGYVPRAELTEAEAGAAKMREAVRRMLHEWDKFARYGSSLAQSSNEIVNFARTTLASSPEPK